MHACLPLETNRLMLRQFQRDDVEAFYSWRDSADVARYTLWDYPYSFNEASAFCEEQAELRSFPSRGWCQLMIEHRVSGKGIGDIGLGIRVDGVNTLTLGYSLHPDYWRQGLMYEALETLLPVLSKVLGFQLIKAVIDVRNPASGKLLERLGFQAGPIIEHASLVKGEWCDELEYLLRL